MTEAEVLLHVGSGPPKVVAQHVKGGIHRAENDPVQTASLAKAGRVMMNDRLRGRLAWRHEGQSMFRTVPPSQCKKRPSSRLNACSAERGSDVALLWECPFKVYTSG